MKMGNAYTTTTDSVGQHVSDERSIYFERERCKKCNRNACFARVVEAQIASRRKSYGNFAIPGSIYFRPDIGSILTNSSPALNDDAPYHEKHDQPNYPFGPTSVPPGTNAVGTESTGPSIKQDGSSKPAPLDSNANNDAPRKKHLLPDNLNENTENQRNLNSNRDNAKEIPVPDQRRAGTSTPVQRASNSERQTPRDTTTEGQPFVNSGVGDETTFQGQIFGQGGGYETSEGQRKPSDPSRNDRLGAPDESFQLDYVPVDELANAGTSPSISRTNSNPSISPPSIPIISPLNVSSTGNSPRPSNEGKLQDNGKQQNGSNVSGTDPRVPHRGLHEPKNGNRSSETKSQGTPETSDYQQPPESLDGPSTRLHREGSRKSSHDKQPDPRYRKLKQIQNRGLSFDDDDDVSPPPALNVQDIGSPQGLQETVNDTSSKPIGSVRDNDNVPLKNNGRANLTNHRSSNDNNEIPSLRDGKLDPITEKFGGYGNARQSNASVPGDQFSRNIEKNKGSGLPGHSEGSRISGGVSHAGNVNNGSLRPSIASNGRINTDSLRGIHENADDQLGPDNPALVSTVPEKSGQPAGKDTSGNDPSLRTSLYGPSGSLNNLPASSGPTSIKEGSPDSSGLVSFGPERSGQPGNEHAFGTGSHLRGNPDSLRGSINNSPLGVPTSIKVGAPDGADFAPIGPNISGQPRDENTTGHASPLRRNSDSPRGTQNGLLVDEPASTKDLAPDSSYLLSTGPNQPGQPTGDDTIGMKSPLRANFEGPSDSLNSSPASIKVVEPANNIPLEGPASIKTKTDPRDSSQKSSYPILLKPQNEQILEPVGTREEEGLNQRPTNGSYDPSGRSSYNHGGRPSTNFPTSTGKTTEIEPAKRSYFDTVSQRLPQSARANSTRGDGGSMVTPLGSNGRDVYPPQQNHSPIAAQKTSSGSRPGNPAEFLPQISTDPDESHTAPLSPSARTSGPSYSNTRVTDSGNSPLSSVDASIYPIYDPENKLRSHPGNKNDNRQPEASFKKDSTASSDSPQTGVTSAGPHKETKVDQAVQDDGSALDSIDLEPDSQRYSPGQLGQSNSIKPSVDPSGDIASSPHHAVVPTKSPNDSLGGPTNYFPLGSGPNASLNKIDTDRPLSPRQRSSDSKSPTSRSLGSADDDDGTAASLPAKDIDGGQHRPIDIRQPTKISGPLGSSGGQEAPNNAKSGPLDDPKLATRNGRENRILTPGDGEHFVPTPGSANNQVDPPGDRKTLVQKGEELSQLGFPDPTSQRTIPNNEPTIGQPDRATHLDAEPRIDSQAVQPTAPNVSSVTNEETTPREIQTGKSPSHDPPRASDDLTETGKNLLSAVPESFNPLDNSSPLTRPKRTTARNDKNGSEHPQGPQPDKIFDKEKDRDAAQSAVGPGITFASVGESPDKRPESPKSESTVHSKEGNGRRAGRLSPRGASSSPLDEPSEFTYESAIGPGLIFKHPTTTGIATNVTETEEITTGPPSPPASRPHVTEAEGENVIGRTPEELKRSPPNGKAKIPTNRPLTSQDKTSARPYMKARPNTQPKLKASGSSVTTLDPKKNFTKLQRPSDKLFRLNHPDNAGCLVKLDNMIAYNKSTKKPIKKDLKMTDFIRVVDSGRGKCLRPQSMRSIESDAELMTCHSSKKRESSCAPWPTAFTIIYPSSSAHCPPGTIRRKDGFFAVPKKGSAHRIGKWYQPEDQSKRCQCSASKEYKPSGGKCSSSRRKETNVQKSCGEVNGSVRPTKKPGDVVLRKVKRPQALKPTVLDYEKLPSGLQDSFKNLQNELDQYVQVCHQVNENLNDENHTPRLGPTEPAWSPIRLTPRKRKHDECHLIRNPPLICPDPNPCCWESYCPCNPCRPQECCYNNAQCIPCVPMAYNVCSAEQIQVNDPAASQISATKEDDKIDALVQETLSNAEIGLTRALGSRTSLTISDGATDLSEWMNRLRGRLATGMNMPLEIKGSRCSSDDDISASALQNIDKEKMNKPSGSELDAARPEEREENLQNVLQGIDHALQSPNMSAQSSILNMASLLDSTRASAENDASLQIAGLQSEELRPMSGESSYASMVPSDCVSPVPRAMGSSNNSRPVRVRFSNPIVQEYWTPDRSQDSIDILLAEVDSNDNYRFLADGNVCARIS